MLDALPTRASLLSLSLPLFPSSYPTAAPAKTLRPTSTSIASSNTFRNPRTKTQTHRRTKLGLAVPS